MNDPNERNEGLYQTRARRCGEYDCIPLSFYQYKRSDTNSYSIKHFIQKLYKKKPRII